MSEVGDSSIRHNPSAYASHYRKNDSLRVGMVRERVEASDGSVRYVVECYIGGNQVPVSCKLMTKFGGVYNFEEYNVRPWASAVPAGFLPPTTASSYDLRSGDTVIVGFINGEGREGIILGGIPHEGRSPELGEDIEYLSKFNGVETKIDSDGAYTLTFNGTPLNELELLIPGKTITPPQHNPLTAGSFLGFDADGGFTVDMAAAGSAANSSIKITKSAADGSITLESGKSTIALSGNAALGETAISTDTLSLTASKDMTIDAKVSLKAETLQMSLKGTKMAIGNDSFELFEGLLSLIDALGQVTVTSPVGTCTPIMASPQWASGIIPIQVKLQAIKGSL